MPLHGEGIVLSGMGRGARRRPGLSIIWIYL